jgi:hypothetical protein
MSKVHYHPLGENSPNLVTLGGTPIAFPPPQPLFSFIIFLSTTLLTRSQSFDHELQCQRCKNLQRN